jgi:hypothetical protein
LKDWNDFVAKYMWFQKVLKDIEKEKEDERKKADKKDGPAPRTTRKKPENVPGVALKTGTILSNPSTLCFTCPISIATKFNLTGFNVVK